MEQELAFKLKEDRIFYQTQVEIPVTIADLYFPTQPRPLIVFVDGRVHLGKTQMFKDEELRSLLRKKGFQVLELLYYNYSDKRRDELYHLILDCMDSSRSASLGPQQVLASLESLSRFLKCRAWFLLFGGWSYRRAAEGRDAPH